MQVGVIGLGKLGFCTAACLAKGGHTVRVYDANEGVMQVVCAGKAPIAETGIGEFIEGVHLNVEESTEDVVELSEVILIIVPTPSSPAEPAFTTQYVENVLRHAGPVLGKDEKYRVIDVVSTVMPGAHRELIAQLEKASGVKCGKRWGYVYNPEFIAIGSVLHDFLHPDMVLIGESDQRAGIMVELMYREMLENFDRTRGHNICRMGILDAEITKLTLNCYVTMKISFANQLALLCETIPGSDAATVLKAVGCDSRVGGKYLRPGLGFGGPCFPRDVRAWTSISSVQNLALATRDISAYVDAWVLQQCSPKDRVVVLGVAYKPDTHVIEESKAVYIARELMSKGCQCVLHDPQARAEEVLEQVPGAWWIPTHNSEFLVEHLKQADVVLITTAWPMYRKIDWSQLKPGAKVIDMWGVVETPLEGFGLDYRRFGHGR